MTELKAGKTDLRFVFRSLTGRDVTKQFKVDFETRLIFQKTMYLLGAARAVRPSYSFGLHLYGPYSSGWAKRGYEASEGTPVELELTPRVTKVQDLVSNRGTGELVSLATLHFYHRRLQLTKAAAHEKAKTDCKLTVLDNFDAAWAKLDAVGWLD